MDKIIGELIYNFGTFPRKALEEAVKRNDEMTPLLLGALDDLLRFLVSYTQTEKLAMTIWWPI